MPEDPLVGQTWHKFRRDLDRHAGLERILGRQLPRPTPPGPQQPTPQQPSPQQPAVGQATPPPRVERYPKPTPDPTRALVQLIVTILFIVGGFSLLLFGKGEQRAAGTALLGLVGGYWLR